MNNALKKRLILRKLEKEGKSLNGKYVVLWSLDDELSSAMSKLIKRHGGRIQSSVDEKTSYLVYNDRDSIIRSVVKNVAIGALSGAALGRVLGKYGKSIGGVSGAAAGLVSGAKKGLYSVGIERGVDGLIRYFNSEYQRARKLGVEIIPLSRVIKMTKGRKAARQARRAV